MPRSRPRGLSRRRLLRSGTALAGAIVGTGCSPGEEDGTVTVEDVQGRDPLDLDVVSITGLHLPGRADDRVAVTIRGRRILAVGEPEPGAQVLDAAGGTVIPGFIDSHVHMQFSSVEAVLAGGVTAVRDLGSPPDAAQALIGRTPLKVLIAGRILTPVGGYPTRSWGADGTAREVSDAEDALEAVAEQVAAGATVVKVALEDAGGSPLFDLEVVEVIVVAAADAGLRTTAHVGSARALEIALGAGVAELCHLPLHDVTPAEMVAVAEAGVVVVPTLEIRPPDEAALAALAAFRQAGGQVLYGSDLGNGGTAPGIEVREVELMLAAGMTGEEVLASATADAATYLGLDNGRIEAGAVADLVVLGGDPLRDPRAYDDIRLVIASGEVIGGG